MNIQTGETEAKLLDEDIGIKPSALTTTAEGQGFLTTSDYFNNNSNIILRDIFKK